jgi:hypothetical protein
MSLNPAIPPSRSAQRHWIQPPPGKHASRSLKMPSSCRPRQRLPFIPHPFADREPVEPASFQRAVLGPETPSTPAPRFQNSHHRLRMVRKLPERSLALVRKPFPTLVAIGPKTPQGARRARAKPPHNWTTTGPKLRENCRLQSQNSPAVAVTPTYSSFIPHPSSFQRVAIGPKTPWAGAALA